MLGLDSRVHADKTSTASQEGRTMWWVEIRVAYILTCGGHRLLRSHRNRKLAPYEHVFRTKYWNVFLVISIHTKYHTPTIDMVA